MHEPTFDAKTVQTAVQWTSPDGKRTIHEIVLERPDGKKHKVKTFSDAIAEHGWSGTVQAYEKQGRGGQTEIYVKQPPKENSQYTPRSSGASRPNDDNGKSFYYSYAKDIAVACIEAGIVTDFTNAIHRIAEGGETLWLAANSSQPDPKQPSEPTQADIDSLKDVFPETSGKEHAVDTDYDPLFN